MMAGFGQTIPDAPTVPGDKDRILRVRLLLEEVFELAAASGVSICVSDDFIESNFNPDPGPHADRAIEFEDISFSVSGSCDMAGVVDALSDISVVNTGAFVTYGLIMEPFLELTDANNLMKIANGHLDAGGKFIKAPNHPVPNYRHALACQGWVEPAAAAVKESSQACPQFTKTTLHEAVPDETVSDTPDAAAFADNLAVSTCTPQSSLSGNVSDDSRRGLADDEIILDGQHGVAAVLAYREGRTADLAAFAARHIADTQPAGIFNVATGSFRLTNLRTPGPTRVVYKLTKQDSV